jgi:hypothetical protein
MLYTDFRWLNSCVLGLLILKYSIAVPILNNGDLSKKVDTVLEPSDTKDHSSRFQLAKDVLLSEFSRVANSSDALFPQMYGNFSEFEHPYYDEDLEEEHINFRWIRIQNDNLKSSLQLPKCGLLKKCVLSSLFDTNEDGKVDENEWLIRITGINFR